MNTAERALRRCTAGPPLRAVYILDRWTPENRAEFREAFRAEEWMKVHRLCILGTKPNTPLDRMVLNHLLDATAPEGPVLTMGKKPPRRV